MSLVSGTLLATLISMKRAVVTAVFLCAVAALSGCPIYSHEDEGCFRNSDCAPGYACDDNSGQCLLQGNGNFCSRPEDCGSTQTCGSLGQCASGDCSFNGCVSGYRCDSSSGTWMCVSKLSGSAGSSGDGSSGGEAGQAGGR